MAFAGVLGLLGGNEMRPACRPFDEALLAAAGQPDEVCVVPTAVVRNGSVSAALGLARSYFGALGLRVVHVELHRRRDASDQAVVARLKVSPLTYILGGDPGYLLETLRDSPAWDAMLGAAAGGGSLAGSSAGAMVMAETLLLRSPNPRPESRHAKAALDLVPNTVVIPHLQEFGHRWLVAARREAAGRDILGLDEATGLVFAGDWTAHGPGRVRLWREGADPATELRHGDRLEWRSPRG